MKVLLIKDVYNLGRAGDVKKVADGYGRNYLIPQGLALLATPGALKQAEAIRKRAEARRSLINAEMSEVANAVSKISLAFAVKAGETGKLYGSITTQDVANALTARLGKEIRRQQVDMQPIRTLGEFKARIRLTMDLIPEVTIYVHREGEAAPVSTPETEATDETAEASA